CRCVKWVQRGGGGWSGRRRVERRMGWGRGGLLGSGHGGTAGESGLGIVVVTDHGPDPPGERHDQGGRRADRDPAPPPIDGRRQRTHRLPHITERISPTTTCCEPGRVTARRDAPEAPERLSIFRAAATRPGS